ncbi:MAG TPA: alpha-glucan family phosphorylase [Burkholderiaceae bacterium]|nr:alpha-glucan family phosphorylase [Burkholderiaceae bacterium]
MHLLYQDTATDPPAAQTIGPYLARTRIAYFSMEMALRPEMHTYSGGLGVLAGDTARSCADLGLPIVFVTLVCRQGYLRQEIDAEGRQVEHADPWEPAEYAAPLRAKVAVLLEGREVWVRPWLHVQRSPIGSSVPVLLLDTDLPENAPQDRGLTARLYGPGADYRLKQEIVLGIGGLRILQALGFDIRTHHMNEGHAALLALDLMRRYPRQPDRIGGGGLAYRVTPVREACIFTTHTPVEAGHDRFDYGLFEHVMPGYVATDQVRRVAGEDALNMTRLALNLSGFVNGVAQRHAQTTSRMFPGYDIRAITNGVHLPTWVHPEIRELLDAYAPAWAYEPETLVRADQLPAERVWHAHRRAKDELIEAVRTRTGVAFDPELPLIGFARRMTAYKRPDLLFSDLERLRAIARRHPFQVVLAGKSHPADEPGKATIQRIHHTIRELAPEIRMAFVPGYETSLAKHIVSGVDVWLNTPIPPLEASGTSGMKAALNGVLNLSVLDGWWLEACVEGVTGWAIGRDGDFSNHDGAAAASAEDLYAKLEQAVLPMYHHDRERWVWMMRQAMSKIPCYFNTQRMMRRYAAEAYIR